MLYASYFYAFPVRRTMHKIYRNLTYSYLRRSHSRPHRDLTSGPSPKEAV
jgi:hypothetical protein